MWARVTRTHGDPSTRDRGIALITEQIIPAAKQFPGFKGGYWLADETGNVMAIVLFDNRDALQASDAPAEAMREQAKQLGATIDSVETFEVIAQA
jgi:hypothetical protein